MNTTECNSSPASLPPAEEPNWQRIEQQHREGRASTRAIARSHGLPDAAIRKHAMLMGWMGCGSILPALTDDDAGAWGAVDLLPVSGQLASVGELDRKSPRLNASCDTIVYCVC